MTIDTTKIDAEVQRLMQSQDVQGLAVAIIHAGTLAHLAAYGWRNAEQHLPLTTDTIMYGASLTKTAFAYMVLQLVDDGWLGLDTSLDDLLPYPLPEYDKYIDLADDKRWRALTLRVLLMHGAGFANWTDGCGSIATRAIAIAILVKALISYSSFLSRGLG
ncbi:MAG: serine hydrolase domain-containing protein [Chloroflexota bacterium]